MPPAPVQAETQEACMQRYNVAFSCFSEHVWEPEGGAGPEEVSGPWNCPSHRQGDFKGPINELP